jgi:hypothetical protein
MPLGWIHDLSKQQVEELAGQLGLPIDGTLDDLRKRVKQKWAVIEPYLPSSSAAKSTLVSESNVPCNDSSVQASTHLTKVKFNVVSDLIKNVPLLSGTDPESILRFLIRVCEVYDLKLVSDFEFLSLLVSRTSGRVMQILGGHLATTRNWGIVRAQIISTFLPPRLKEKFLLISYVLDRFQSSTEDLNTYIMLVVVAADILGFSGSESQLVQRMLQNMHPRTRSHLLFASKPQSVQEFYSLSTTVAEAVAVEDQRKLSTALPQQNCASRPLASGMLVTNPSPAVADFRAKCWKCGKRGHLQRNCVPTAPHNCDPVKSGKRSRRSAVNSLGRAPNSDPSRKLYHPLESFSGNP